MKMAINLLKDVNKENDNIKKVGLKECIYVFSWKQNWLFQAHPTKDLDIENPWRNGEIKNLLRMIENLKRSKKIIEEVSWRKGIC